MDAVNLLPAEYRAQKRGRLAAADGIDSRRTLRLGGAVTLAFVLLIGALYVHERSVVSHDKSALAQSQAKFATLEAQARPLKAAEALTAGRVAAAQSITGATMNWDKALGDFARVMPTNSSLSSLNLTAAPAIAPPPPTTTDTSSTSSSSSSSSTTTTAAPAPTGGQLTIGGTAPNTNGVALVLDRLALLPWLQGVTLSSASRQPDGSNTFNIVAAASQER